MPEISKRLMAKAGQNRIPLTGAFELLPTCNFSCEMCYVRKTREEVEKEGGLLPAKYWLDVAKEMAGEGLLFPLLTGGEPFLREDIKEIICGMTDMGMQLSINTNGSLIDEKMAKWLGSNTPTRINLTLYGASEESYAKVCGNGDGFRKVRNAIQYLKGNHVPLKFNCSITPNNMHDIKSIVDFSKEVEVPLDMATYMTPPFRRGEEFVGKNNRMTADEAGYARAYADFLISGKDIFEKSLMAYRHFEHVTDDMIKRQSAMPKKEMKCRAGRCSFWLDWKGNLGICGLYTPYSIPLELGKFKESWDKIVEYTNNLKVSSVCMNCPNNMLCHSCMSMIHNECGNLDGRPEYLCDMTEATAKYYEEFWTKYYEQKN